MKTNIFEYLDYRQFLKDAFQELKSTKSFFSHRYFIKKAGLASPSHLNMAMNGTRNLTLETARKIAKALDLNKKQSEYFEVLVLYNQSKNPEDRENYFQQLCHIKPPSEIQELSKDHVDYLTKRHLVIIREMVALPHFEADAKWIAEHLRVAVKPAEVEEAIQILLRLKLLKETKQGKGLQHSSTALQKKLPAKSLELVKYNLAILKEACDAILHTEEELQFTTSMTIPMNEKSIDHIKKILFKAQEQIANYINNSSEPFDEVFQIHMQLFPATKSKNSPK